ncbi:MAG: hypothetical protein HQL58_13180 [Magnetococcales bacterium]|nr:hypothetical protein [Magnetococcales bacterium]
MNRELFIMLLGDLGYTGTAMVPSYLEALEIMRGIAMDTIYIDDEAEEEYLYELYLYEQNYCDEYCIDDEFNYNQ